MITRGGRAKILDFWLARPNGLRWSAPVASGAGMETVTETATTPKNPEFPRDWTTFSQGIDEVIDARIYIGFHFRTSGETGARMGRQVARFVFNHALND